MRYLILFFLILTTLFANNSKEILLLHSYNSGLKWSDGITSGVKEVFDKYPNYELTIEYMDSKKIDTKEYLQSLTSLYEKKFSNRKYDVIITADNYAYEFAMQNHKKLFNNSNIVFCGVENFVKSSIPKDLEKYITGVVEYKDIKNNIKLIKELIPNLNTIYIISDSAYSSLAIKEQILEDIKEFEKDTKIIFDNQIDMDTLEQKVNSLPQNCTVLFTSLYKDKNEKYITYSQIRDFFNSSKYPIFALNKIHLGEGIVGGIMVNPLEQGILTAKKSVEVIEGKKPNEIDISIPNSKYYFDYEVLKKYKIDSSKIPVLSTVINSPENFFEKNRKFIDSAFVLMPLLILLIIGLIVNIFKRVSLEIKLVEQSKLDNVLLNNIRGAIFWKSKENKLLGCNEAFCKLVDLQKEQILGKDINEIVPELCSKINKYDFFIHEFETTIKIKNETLNVLIRRKQYFNKKDEEAGVVTVIHDITDFKKLQEQNKKDEQFIIQRSKLSEIGEMMTSIAHQWKAPLIEISTIAQELLYKRSKKEFSKEDSQEFVYEIMTQVSYMTKTIDDFRDFIKPSLKKSRFEINSSIDELLKIIEHNIKYNYIKIDVSYENNQIFKVFGYENEFKQAILNIINNGKDAILKRRLTQKVDGLIKIDVYSKNSDICIEIKDNGIGIEEEKLEKIFEPFFTSKENGDGFGLYMVKLIVEDKMNGKIKAVKSDNGANILITLKSEEV
jgi:PAS domain S-box-containing protein